MAGLSAQPCDSATFVRRRGAPDRCSWERTGYQQRGRRRQRPTRRSAPDPDLLERLAQAGRRPAAEPERLARAPASRSPCTRAPRSSRSATSSPAAALEGRLRTWLEDALAAAFGRTCGSRSPSTPTCRPSSPPRRQADAGDRRGRASSTTSTTVDMSTSRQIPFPTSRQIAFVAPDGPAGTVAARPPAASWRRGSTRSTSSRPSSSARRTGSRTPPRSRRPRRRARPTTRC